jgi:hypothetical protein
MAGEMDNAAPHSAGDQPPADDGKKRDPLGPPEVPCECFCLHCRRTFMSDKMWFQRVIGSRDGFDGFWMCPTPNCSGAGFEFDIFPTDPNHPSNEGWIEVDDEDEWSDDENADEEWVEGDEAEEVDAEWDPDEPLYGMMDELPEDEDDLEGEEWKYGVGPGETPKVEPPPPGVEPRNWMEEEALFDAPDRRPRELDWTSRESEKDAGSSFGEDEIPF